MKAQQVWTQGVGDDGTLLTFTPCPSPHHVIFCDVEANREMWGIQIDPRHLIEFPYKQTLGVIIASEGFTYYRVIE